MIAKHIIDEIKSQADIWDVVNDVAPLKGNKCKCPLPGHEDKTPSFQVNKQKQIFKCFGCGRSGDVFTFTQEMKCCDFDTAVRIIADKYRYPITEQKEYTKPVWKNNTELSDKVVKWFEGRRISQKTLTKARITQSVEWMPKSKKEQNTINFNYFRKGELVNVKYRDGAKDFKMHSGAELIFYNLDAIEAAKSVYIVEGEIDCLSFIESGLDAVLSVPNGATKDNNNLAYLDNCIEHLKGKRIHICTDDDPNGRGLRNELARRLGLSNCDYVVFPDAKDANEYLCKHTKTEFVEAAKKIKDFPIEGSFTIEDFEDEIDDMFINGLPPAMGVGIPAMDKKVGFLPGYLCVVTGFPSHGKSNVVDEICLRLLTIHGWKGAFYSPEHKPTALHFSKFARKMVGKSWTNGISKSELEGVKDRLNKSLWFIRPKKGFTLEDIFASVTELVTAHGIKWFVIDAWNKLDHKDDSSSFIGKSLDQLEVFCQELNVLCFLVAHPSKPQTLKDGSFAKPTLYNISGSANFKNKCDIGLVVHRDFDNNTTDIVIEKIKYEHWGELGSTVTLAYDVPSSRYIDQMIPIVKQTGSWLTEPIQIEFEMPEPLKTLPTNTEFENPKYNEQTDTFDTSPF